MDVRTIVLVHGDGDFTWHDSSGRRKRADVEAVKQAREMGVRPGGEVFLFHLRRGGGWFSRHDGTWEHYRAGSRVSRGTYSRTEKDTAFEAEARILRRGEASGATAPGVTRLAYFGHELPVTDEPGYFRGHPERPFSQARFARALEALAVPRAAGADAGALAGAPIGAGSPAAAKPYETIVLSMCYGGNPALVSALRPLAHWLVASPAYLHLSYLDARALGDPGLAAGSAAADTVAARSFARLSANVSTEITAGVYDLARVNPPPVPAFPAARASGSTSGLARDRPIWKDCAEAPGFDSASAAVGTRLLYRSPRFGAARDKTARSAWQCMFQAP